MFIDAWVASDVLVDIVGHIWNRQFKIASFKRADNIENWEGVDSVEFSVVGSENESWIIEAETFEEWVVGEFEIENLEIGRLCRYDGKLWLLEGLGVCCYVMVNLETGGLEYFDDLFKFEPLEDGVAEMFLALNKFAKVGGIGYNVNERPTKANWADKIVFNHNSMALAYYKCHKRLIA